MKDKYGWPCKNKETRKDESTRKLACCRKVVVKKDWKTTLLLLPNRSRVLAFSNQHFILTVSVNVLLLFRCFGLICCRMIL